MTFGTVVLSLFDGFFGAIFGGLIAAWIALHTAKQALNANAAAQDRDRALAAALRFREFVATYTSATAGGAQLDNDMINRFSQDQHIALKSAQFARHGDTEFAEWTGWVTMRLVEGIVDSRSDYAHAGWLGNIAKMLEGRLFEGAELEYLEPPARS
ncbi:hypothetical protein C8K30_104448 [Promicromonospora sp. AC04]|uniref:hypothetical protein n=1 Tax=Promicromonospora sp. AC04 TaxID=2135723 RepID=UPI000D34DB6D|nr:hypothetical protein [Promicromonospora sp. AC04]PUB27992.1 hypothetical protein C8K30_104448 [Promicromonospora sp. AC04]